MELRARFRAHLGTLPLPSRRLLLAVSGGPDSLALLDLMHGVRDELELELAVGHVDHGIHSESGAVAERVLALAARYGVSCFSRVLSLGPATGETEARGARYAALEELRREWGAGAIVTAHHADDQAETVLMRVLGGTGPAGLAGMPPLVGGVLRPLLPFRRSELARHVQALGLPLWEDPANRNPRHDRSWIREAVLPLLRERIADVDSRLVRVAAHASADRSAWDAVLDALPELDLRCEDDAVLSVAAPALARLDPALALATIRALTRRWGRPIGPRRAARVLAVVEAGASGTTVQLGGGAVAELAFGRLRLVNAACAPHPPWELAGETGERVSGRWKFQWRRAPAPERQLRDSATAWFAPAKALAVRPWRAGDRLRPLGGAGRRLLVRCFQDARVPRSARAAWPVVEHEGVIAWVPGVCRSDLLVPAPGVEALRVDVEPV
jgi:tRNA(Ile)-lysidine synthase